MMPLCVMWLLYTSENPAVYLGESESERDNVFILLRKYFGPCGICEVVLGTPRSPKSQFEDCWSRDLSTFRFILFWVEKGKNTPRWYCVFLLNPIGGRCSLIELLLMLRLIWVTGETLFWWWFHVPLKKQHILLFLLFKAYSELFLLSQLL